MSSPEQTVAKHLMRAASMLIKHCNANNIALRSGDTDFLKELNRALDAAEGAFEPWISDEEMLREMEEDEKVLTTQTWGEKCEDYEPQCPTCQAWRLFGETKRAPFNDEVTAAINEANEKE